MECLESVLCFVNLHNLGLCFILVQVGNQAFANYVDTRGNLEVTHINNKLVSQILNLDLMNLKFCRIVCRKDLVPILPGILYASVLLLWIFIQILSDQDVSWVTVTHLVKCTSWTMTNGFPVPVKKIYLMEKEGGLLTLI